MQEEADRTYECPNCGKYYSTPCHYSGTSKGLIKYTLYGVCEKCAKTMEDF